jgi:predicted DNA-binding protein
MNERQIPFNFQMPKELLEKLRQDAKETGVPVSSLIKIAIKKMQMGEKEE